MTQPSSLFRREALEFQTSQPQGGILRNDPWWIRWAYWITLALVLAGMLIAWTARTSETTSGPVLIDVRERTFVALVPDAASHDLRPGQLVRLDPKGQVGRTLTARTVKVEVADQAGIARAGFASSSQPAVLVTGALPPDANVSSVPASPNHEGQAVIVLRSQRLLDLFLRQLRGTLGKEGES